MGWSARAPVPFAMRHLTVSEMTLWVRNDRFAMSAPCPLVTRKRPHRCLAVTDAKGRKQTHALQHDRTEKQVTDLPIEACYRPR
jgi:hypothetical protein